MNHRLARFCLLGLRFKQAAIACRDASQLDVSAIAAWISRCVTAWETIKTAANAPTAIAKEIETLLTEALHLAAALPVYDIEDVIDNARIIEVKVRTIDQWMHTHLKSVAADQGAIRDAYLLGSLLADLEDPELTEWISGEDAWSPTMPQVEELLPKTGMILDDILINKSDGDELLEGELPSMRRNNWASLEAGLAARCQTGQSEMPNAAEEDNEDNRLSLENPNIRHAEESYNLHLHHDGKVERSHSQVRVQLQDREFKLLLHFLDKGDEPTPLDWLCDQWGQFGRKKTKRRSTIDSTISSLNNKLEPLRITISSSPNKSGWILEDLSQGTGS